MHVFERRIEKVEGKSITQEKMISMTGLSTKVQYVYQRCDCTFHFHHVESDDFSSKHDLVDVLLKFKIIKEINQSTRKVNILTFKKAKLKNPYLIYF